MNNGFDQFGRRASNEYHRGGGLRGVDRRDSYEDRPPHREYRGRSRSPPYRGRSRSPPPRRSRSRSPRRYDDRGPPRRYDDRRRDSFDGRRDSFEEYRGPPRDDDRGRRPRADSRGPPPKEQPRSNEAEWTSHLTPLPEGEEELRLGGCVLKRPPAAAPLSFWKALEAGDTSRAEACLEAGQEVDEVGGAYGSTALGWAAFAADVELVRLLLKRGASTAIAAAKGSYPLHMAVWNGDHAEVVSLLLAAGAKASAKNGGAGGEKTALQVAKWFDELESSTGAETVCELASWREGAGKPPAGRSAVIELLTAAEAAEEAAAGDAVKSEVEMPEAGGEEAAAKAEAEAAVKAEEEAAVKAEEEAIEAAGEGPSILDQ